MKVKFFLSKTFLFVVLVNLCALLLWGGAFFYLGNLKDRLAMRTAELSQVRANTLAAASLEKLLSETEGDRAKLREFFVTEETTAVFLEKLESLAQATGVEFDPISLQKEEKTLVLHFQSTGSFSAIYSFLKMVETLPYKLSLENFEIRAKDAFWEGSFALIIGSFIPLEVPNIRSGSRLKRLTSNGIYPQFLIYE